MTKLSLTDREWKEFFIGGKNGIFSIKATKSGIDKNKLNDEKGNIPYITRTDIDNGINLFITDKQNSKYKQDNGNVITIGLDTQTVFYQENSFFTGQNIQVLSFDKLNKHIALFIIPLLKIQMRKFSWGGNGATLGRLNKTKIMLPTNQLGNPDWQFMEDYIKQLEQEKIQEIVDYYQNKLLGCLINNQIGGKPYIKKWANFKISELFYIKIGKNIDGNKVNKENGHFAYITRKEQNNGLDGFINFSKNFLNTDYPVITIGNETAEPFVHTYPFFTGTKVNILKPKQPMSKQILTFICISLKQHKSKYSYSFTINSSRLQQQTILLPIDEQGNPDWQFMEEYIKSIEYDKIQAILQHLNDNHSQHSTAQHSTAQHSTAQHSTAQHSTAQHSKAKRNKAQISIIK